MLGICKTFYYNFKLLPFKQAIHLPIVMSGKTVVKLTHKGSIIFTSPSLRPAMLSFGMSHLDYSYPAPNFVKIEGRLIIHGSGNHLIGPGGTLVIRKTGTLEIGNDFGVGHFSRFTISAHSKIGDNNMHSWQNLYMDNDSHPILNSEKEIINPPKGFEIGDNVWFGARCTILKGVKVSDGCIIATNSLLTKSLEDKKSIYASSQKLKEDVTWLGTIV